MREGIPEKNSCNIDLINCFTSVRWTQKEKKDNEECLKKSEAAIREKHESFYKRQQLGCKINIKWLLQTFRQN